MFICLVSSQGSHVAPVMEHFNFVILVFFILVSLTALTTKNEYLCKYEAICENALTLGVSDLDGGVLMKNTGGRKSRDRVPLNYGNYFGCIIDAGET
jgi:hypothetical protein